MKITSPFFKENAEIPVQFTGQGKDESPAIDIAEVPEKAKTIALVVEDPDAPNGTFTHWLLYNLPPAENHLEKNLPRTYRLPNGARQGVNDFKKVGYGGPCPPSGTHRYFFKAFALDTDLKLPEKEVTREKLLNEMKGHVIADAQLMGIFQKVDPECRKKDSRDWKVEESSKESFPASDPPSSY